MNRFLGTLFAALLALGLTACGGDDDDGPIFADGSPPSDAPVPPPDADPPDATPPLDATPPMPDAEPPPDAPVSDFGPEVTLEEIIQGVVVKPVSNSTDFSAAAVVTAPQFTVRCKAEPNGMTMLPVDAVDGVEISVVSGAQVQFVIARPTTEPHMFEADFDVPNFPNGPFEIRCTAKDIASPPELNSDTTSTFIDLGPTINVFNPIPSASYATQIDVLVQVLPDAVDAGDANGDLINASSVELCIAGTSIPWLTEPADPTAGGFYTARIYFDFEAYGADPDYMGDLPFDVCQSSTLAPEPAWEPPIDGASTVTFHAANQRDVAGAEVEREERVNFVADSVGPIIAITNPVPGQLVGGVMFVQANVSDPAGISEVGATIAHDFEIIMTSGGSSTYVGAFDTRTLPDTFVYPLVEVRAKDGVGNESSVGRIVVLDNQAPFLALDPPEVREAEGASDAKCLATDYAAAIPACNNGDISAGPCSLPAPPDPADDQCCWRRTDCATTWFAGVNISSQDGRDCASQCLENWGCDSCFECSLRFDPVGPEGVDDLDIVGQLGNLRVRGEDTGNRPAGAPSTLKIPLATMAEFSLQTYVYDDHQHVKGDPDDTNPLLVDTDADGKCDAINPAIVPAAVPMTDMEMAVVDLHPLVPSGIVQLCSDTLCGVDPYGDDPLMEDESCTNYPFHFDPDPAPVCAATDLQRVIQAEDGSGPAIYSIPPTGCMGNPFDFLASNTAEGWACIVAVGEDKLGNFGISPPIRVCVSYDATPPAECFDPGEVPICSDGCEYPASFDKEPRFQLVEKPAECSDGIDNDGDGQIDFPDDVFCFSPDDPSES